MNHEPKEYEMDTFEDGTTTEEQAVIIAMTEITAIHRDFDASYSQVPSDATEQQASKVRYYLAKLHDDLGYKMKFDFVPLLIDDQDGVKPNAR
tara:strand:+ start:1692 stop:1970 length:279 start_codon:yes stop_codon:yes gene_type:complete